MLDQEVSLEQLAEEAKKHPPKSVLRQQALTKLTTRLLNPNFKWFIANKDGFDPCVHQEIVEEAKQEVFMHIFKNIDDYDQKKSLVKTWVNFLFNNRYKDYRLKYLQVKKIQDNNQIKLLYTISNENFLQTLKNPDQSRQSVENLINFIEKDSTKKLQQIKMKQRPDINFRAIALQVLDGLTWKQIADAYEVKQNTVYSFFYRTLQELKLFFQKNLDI